MSKEREVSGKIISTDDACNWNLTVAALKDYDHVYVNGIRYTEYQPKQDNIQYLLDQVARLTAENAMLKEKWSTQKREPLINKYVLNAFKADDEATHPYSYWAGVEFAEKYHGIGGEE